MPVSPAFRCKSNKETLAAQIHPGVKGLKVFFGVNLTKISLKAGRKELGNWGNRNHELRNVHK